MSWEFWYKLMKEHTASVIVCLIFGTGFFFYADTEFAHAEEFKELREEIVSFKLDTEILFVEGRISEVRSDIYEIQRFIRESNEENPMRELDRHRLQELEDSLTDLQDTRRALLEMKADAEFKSD